MGELIFGAGAGAVHPTPGKSADPAAAAVPGGAAVDQLRAILGEQAPPPSGPAAVREDRSILGAEAPEPRPPEQNYVDEAMRNLGATSRTAQGTLDVSSTPGKAEKLTGVSAEEAAGLARRNYEGVIRGLYGNIDNMPTSGPEMAAFIDNTAMAVNAGIVKPDQLPRTADTKFPNQTAAADLPAAHAQFSEELAARLADPNADPVETAAWTEWRANLVDHFWSDGVGKTSKALAAVPLMRAGLPLPRYPANREFFAYAKDQPRVDPNDGGAAYLGPAWDRFNAFYHTLVEPPVAQQRAQLKAMLADPNVALEDIANHPMVRQAVETNNAAMASASPEDLENPEWRAQRVYDFGGQPVQGADAAVERLTDHARAFSTASPVENGHRAVILLGPPAAGKSTVAEPLARDLRAALVDADEAKKVIPEYRNGLGTSAVHEESSVLTKGVFKNLVREGANIILPKVGDSYDQMKGIIDLLKKQGYRVDIVHVAATPEISGRRNIARFVETGRIVPPDFIRTVGDKPRDVAYMLKAGGDTNDFLDVNTSKGLEIVEGSGPLAEIFRARSNPRQAPDRGATGIGRGTEAALIGFPPTGLRPHRVTAADGTAVDVAPVVVEADSLRTSQDYGYDPTLQPRNRDRAASQAQVRNIATNLDPERLGYSSEADRGAPIVGGDRMVESGNGRVLALRRVYDQNGDAAQAYRDWLVRQGVDVGAYRNPVLVRQRLTPMSPEERRAFTVASNQAATLAMSAPERARSDAALLDAGALALIHNPDDLGSAGNRAFFRRFVSLLPQSEQGAMADAKGALSAEGLARSRNAVLAKAYGDDGILSRIAESTNDEIKSISNALVSAAPAWARMRAEIEAGRVRADMDVTKALVEAVSRTADLRGRGEKLDHFLAQQDAFDRLPAPVEAFMRAFYDPKGRRAASAQRVTDALRFYAQEAGKVSAERDLGLGLVPVEPRDILKLAGEREWENVGSEVSDRGGVGDGTRGEAGGREARGPWLGAGREGFGEAGEGGDQEAAARAQRPDERRIATFERNGGRYENGRFVRHIQDQANAWLRDHGAVPREIVETRDVVLPSGDVLRNRTLRRQVYDLSDGRTVRVETESGSNNPAAPRADRASIIEMPDEGTVKAQRPLGEDREVRLLAAEKAAIRDYSGGHAIAANTLLRRGPKEFREQYRHMGSRFEGQVERTIRALDSVAERSRLPDDTVLYRGMPLAADTKVGDVLVDKGFMSTARTSGTPKAYADFRDNGKLVEIHADRGAHVIELGEHGMEKGEVVFPRGSELHIRAIRPDRIVADLVDGITAEDGDVMAQRPTREEMGPDGKLQLVLPGGERVSSAELARRRAAEPMRPRRDQRPTDFGLFGETAQQGGLNFGENPPTIGAAETADAGRQGTGIRGRASPVPQGEPARRAAPTPAKRPAQLSLFGGEPGAGPVPVPDERVRQQPGGAKATAPRPGESVTKPPSRSGRTGTVRARPPAVVGGRLEAQQKIAERSRSNYRITPEDQIGIGGPRQKITANIDAIRVLKAIEDENREATPGEKAVLVKYTGWGAFAQDMFSPYKTTWKAERDALRALVNDEEYEAARASTLNAHFTSPEVVRGMWSALDHMGYDGGQAIEPSAGIGHFIGMIPDKVAPKTAWTAVELDSLSGRITKALYGGTDVNVTGFEKLKRPSNYYDLAISNVPFGQYNIAEKPYGSFPIHDFFFVKSLDKVRPGGVVAFITSRFTMDRVDPGTRRLLAKSADLVGAIRLPGGRKGAFAGNAGTEVTTDVLFLRKKVPGEPDFPGANWMGLKEIQTPEGPARINEFFADRPEMMLGEMRLQGSMYSANEPVLLGDTEGIEEKIAAAARNMPQGVFSPRATPKPAPITGEDMSGIKDGSFFLRDGKLYRRQMGEGVAHPLSADDHDRVTRLIGMRGTINDLLATQLGGGDNAPAQSEHLRQQLRDAYDDFVKKYGPINKEDRTVTNRLNKAGEPVVITRQPNLAKFAADPDVWKVSAIENYDTETGKAKRADIQTKDVIDAPKERQINGPSDALAASLNDTGGVDLDHIAQSLNAGTLDDVIHALGDMVYQNPGRPEVGDLGPLPFRECRQKARGCPCPCGNRSVVPAQRVGS